jgi:hypothetical protein
VTTAAFLALAGADAFLELPYAAGNWWLVLLLAWLMPWPSSAWLITGSPWRRNAAQLSSLVVFAWLHLRAMTALLQATSTWRLPGEDPFWGVLTFPLLSAIASLVVALLLTRLLLRVFADESVGASFVVACPFLVATCIDTVFDFSRWIDPPRSNAVWLFMAVFPLLVLMQFCARLARQRAWERSEPRLRPVLSTLYSSVRRIHPGWFSRSPLGPLVVVALTVAGFRLSLDPHEVHATWFYVVAALIVPCSALILTTAAVDEIRRLRSNAPPRRPVLQRLRVPLDLGLTAVVLLPLWAWALLFDAPVVETYARDSIATIPGPNWSVTYDARSRTLELSGEYQSGVARAFTTQLAQVQDVTTVRLEGPGGSEGEAMRIALAIESRSLSTLVDTECASACTTAFLGGRKRTLLEDAALGFHAASSPVLTLSLNETTEHYMTARGVAPNFIRRANSVPPDEMWYPTNEILLEAGVVTHISSQD